MNRLAATTLALLLAVSTAAAAPSSADPARFGAPVTLKKSVPVAKLAAAPAKFKGRTIRIQGTVAEVCQGKGCWVRVRDDQGTLFLARSLDESVLLPKDCAGQSIVVQGVVTMLKPAPKMEEAEEGVPPHECPAPEYVLATQGIELRPAPAAKR